MKKLEISKELLKDNINTIICKAKEDANPPQIIAVVKLNGMGLGLLQVSKFLLENGIDYLAVANAEEALALRKANIDCKILLLTPVVEKDVLKELIKNDIILTIGSEYEINLINSIYYELNIKTIKAHIKVDTGFGRYGFLYTAKEQIKNSFNYKNIEIQGIYTHFSKTMDEKWTNTQFSRFTEVIQYLKENNINPGLKHCCNSTAFFLYPKMHLDAVRIGSAWQGRLLNNIGGLKPVATFKTNIIEIKEVPKGFNVSYTNKYKTKSESKLATIPTGYIDGLNQKRCRDTFSLRDNLTAGLLELKNVFKTNRIKAIINGKQCSIVGRLGTYHAVIDITNIECNVGDEVILDISPVMTNENIKREYV